MSWQIGDRIENRFEIHDIKGGEGKSGFGIVYICYDPQNKVPLALKTFQAKFLSSQKAQKEFTQEAITWTRLDKHKNIVRAYYVKKIEGQTYIFLEYVTGGNLDDWLYTKQLDLPLALNFALQFSTGMDYAYQKMGLIHRDIKPSNILLTQDKMVKITDFGLAKTLEVKPEEIVPSDFSYVQSSTAGTLPYMAPEQFTDQKIDTRADIYSFGIVLYQMITMNYPYQKRSSWLEMHMNGSPLPIKQTIPAELTVLIHKCLQKNPAKRYQNFSKLRQDLSKIYVDLTGETITKESPKELNAYDLVNKGAALRELGRPEEAVACYDQALEIDPRLAQALGNKGVALRALGRPEEALDSYDQALDINLRDATVWNNKGVVLDVLSRPEEALDSYDQSLEINPLYAGAWVNKGIVLGALSRSEEALTCFDQALDINPRYAEAWINKGNELRALSRPVEAITYYDEALKINPLFAEAWYNKGDTLGALGRHEEALACFDQALETNPRFAKAWYNKGVALDALSGPVEAIACYDEALDINPRFANAWYNKGLKFGALGRHEEAISAFQQFIEYAPPQNASNVKKVEEVIRQLKGMV